MWEIVETLGAAVAVGSRSANGGRANAPPGELAVVDTGRDGGFVKGLLTTGT